MKRRRWLLWLLLLPVALAIGAVSAVVVAQRPLPVPLDDAGAADLPHAPVAPEESPSVVASAPPTVAAEPTAPGSAAAKPVPAPTPPPNALSRLWSQLAEAAELGRKAQRGEPEARAALARWLADEPDPRVRSALEHGAIPAVARPSRHAPELPAPAAPAPPGPVEAFWLTPDSHQGTYRSHIEIDAAGRATVETVFEPTVGAVWRVRYPAWAWRDAQGALVIDARNQPVEMIEHPDWGDWSPDSMVVKPDGTVEMIDDRHDPGQGTLGARGPG